MNRGEEAINLWMTNTASTAMSQCLETSFTYLMKGIQNSISYCYNTIQFSWRFRFPLFPISAAVNSDPQPYQA